MSDKISALTEQTSGTLHDDDLLVNVDVSDTTMAASGTNKKSKWSSIKATLKTYFDTLYALASHTHSISDVTSLQTTLDGKAASSHTHSISDVTGLQTALDGKAASSHNHNASDINAGTLDAARLPAPGTTTLGGVKRNAGSAGQYVNGIDTDGSLLYGTPSGGSGGGIVLQAAQTVDTTNRSTASATFVASGVECVLANNLKDTGSKVRIRVQGVVGGSTATIVYFTLYSWDGSTATDLTPSGCTEICAVALASTNVTDSIAFEFVHSPASTTPLTYRLYWKAFSATTGYLGRRGADTNIDCPTFMTLEELD